MISSITDSVKNNHLIRCLVPSLIILFFACNTLENDIVIFETTVSAIPFITDKQISEVLLNRIHYIKTDNRGNIYLLDTGEQHIVKLSSTGDYLKTIGGNGRGPGEFTGIVHFTIASDDRLFVLDRELHRVSIFEPSGDIVRIFSVEGNSPSSLTISPDMEIYINQPGLDQPLFNVYDTTGILIRSAGISEPLGTSWHTEPYPLATETLNRGLPLVTRNNTIHMMYIHKPEYHVFNHRGERISSNVIRGSAIDSVHARKLNIIEHNRNRGATFGPNMMIAVGYFSDFAAINDTTFIAAAGTGNCLYVFNDRAEVVNKIFIEVDESEGVNSLYIAGITLLHNNYIIASDPSNLTIWKMRLNLPSKS